MTKAHVIPVPEGMTPEDAWQEIQTMGELVGFRWWHRFTRRRSWAVFIEEDA